MRSNAKSITTSPKIVRHIEGLTEANFNLRTRLIEWLGENEKRQRKCRFAMVHRRTRIEAAIALLLVGQPAQTQSKSTSYYADKLHEAARSAEKFIASQSEQMSVKMIRYSYGKDQAPEKRHDRRRKWWGWEI